MTGRVGAYTIVGEIGRGGMAVVYLARQATLGRSVALKELAVRDPGFAERFLREARVSGRLNHPNIVTVYDFIEREGVPYIAMEYLERGSLRPFVGRLSLPQIGGVLEGVLAGLSHAESMRIAHRDLKPENLLVTADGGIKITDFGIAKAYQQVATEEMLTPAGATLGTPAYMAPEQAMAQEIGPWTDLYQTGVVAYELLSGGVPFRADGTPLAVMMQHVNDPVPPLPAGTDPTFGAWIAHLLEKDPAARPGGARAAWNELEEIMVAAFGPLWRRDARLGIVEDAAPLSPAQFSSWQDYVPGPRGATPPPPPPPATVPPVTPPPESAATAAPVTPPPDLAPPGAAPPGAASPPPADEPPGSGPPRDTPPAETAAPASPPPDTSSPAETAAPASPPPAASPPPETATPASPPPDTAPPPAARAPTSRHRRALPLALAGAAVAAIVVVALVLLTGDDDGSPTPTATATATATPSPTASPTPTPAPGPFPVGDGPDGIAVGAGAVWAAASRDGTLTRIDPATGETTTIDVGPNPDGVIVAFDDVWVSLTGADQVVRVSTDAQPRVLERIDVGSRPEGLAASGQAVWVANSGDGSLTQILAETNETRDVPGVARQPVDVAIGAGAVWVADAAGDSVARVNGGTRQLVATVRGIGGNPRSLAIVDRDVWVATADDGRAWRIDGDANTAAGSVTVGGQPRDIATDGDHLWVTNRTGDRVVEIDGTDVVKRTPVEGGPLEVDVDDQAVWVTGFDSGDVIRVDRT